jgi:hypothetical protein
LKNARPVAVVKDILEAVALLLGQPENKWEKLLKLISGSTFPKQVQRLNFQNSVTRDQFRALCDKLRHPDFDEEHVKTVCVPVVPLATWCRAVGIYLSKTKFQGGPSIRPIAAASGMAPSMTASIPKLQTPAEFLEFEPDLRKMSLEELRSVKELAVSRAAVGKVIFHGVTDCTNLDFESIVRLEVGEVIVYPEASSKPPVGVGLNKPSTVIMYQCYPPNGHMLLKDLKSQQRYKAKIQQMTEEKHAKFIDYDCATGIWKFGVDHF